MSLTVSLDQIIPFSQARANLADLIDRVPKKKFFVITRRNKPVIALVDINYLEKLLFAYNDFIKLSPHKGLNIKLPLMRLRTKI